MCVAGEGSHDACVSQVRGSHDACVSQMRDHMMHVCRW